MSQLFMILNSFPAQTGCLWPESLLRSWNPIKNFYWYLQPCFSPVSPRGFFVTRELNITNLVTTDITEHIAAGARVRSVFQKTSSETICWVCLESVYREGKGYLHQRGWKTRPRNLWLINKISLRRRIMTRRTRPVLLRIPNSLPSARQTSSAGCTDSRSPTRRGRWASGRSRSSSCPSSAKCTGTLLNIMFFICYVWD